MRWWLLIGLIAVVIVVRLYRKRRARRRSPLTDCPILTKTADGEPLQFLVRATRRTRGQPRP